MFEYQYFATDTGKEISKIDEDRAYWVVQLNLNLTKYPPPDHFKGKRRPSDCDSFRIDSNGCAIITVDKKIHRYKNAEAVQKVADEFRVPVKMIKWLQKKTAIAWVRGKPLDNAVKVRSKSEIVELLMNSINSGRPTRPVSTPRSAPAVVPVPVHPPTQERPLPVPTPMPVPVVVPVPVHPPTQEQPLPAQRLVPDSPASTGKRKRQSNKTGGFDIVAFLGYDKITQRYAVQRDGSDDVTWLPRSELHGTDERWMAISEQHGMPSYDHQRKEFKTIKGGAVTRRMTAASSFSTRASGIPVQFNDGGNLCCLTASYLNMSADFLSEDEKSSLVDSAMSETMLSVKLNDFGYPIRMKTAFWITGIPLKAGDYLISLTDAHTDGLRLLGDGTLMFFPSDQRVSKFVLTQEDDFVRVHIFNRLTPYRAIELIKAPMKKSSMPRAEKRKLKREMEKSAKRHKPAKPAMVPGLPIEIENIILDYASNHRELLHDVLFQLVNCVHDHRHCSSCDNFACWDGCDDGGCTVQDCCSCGMDLCDDCAEWDENHTSWYTCEDCHETICGGCRHLCSCD